MPNWCVNELRVKGPKEELEKFRAKAIFKMGDDYRDLDFDKFVPMPPELMNIHHGGCTINGKSVSNWREVKDEKGNIKNVEVDIVALEKKYGAADWYNWSIANWGTKWNASDVSFKQYKSGMLYTFSTAWSPPNPVVIAMAKQFPELEFSLRYWECGAAYKGILKVKGEEVMEDDTSEYKGRRGG